MAKLFISYRRNDSADAAGRIYDRLMEEFGRQNVFMDVDTIPLGVDFRSFLDDAVGRADVVLAVIGPHWLRLTDSSGQRRLDDPHDFVRLEIEAALRREIPVIPVLVQGATMPGEDQLPAPLQPLAFRNALPVRQGRDFHRDVDRLAGSLRRFLQTEAPQAREEVRSRGQGTGAEPPAARPRVFISYAARDRALVEDEILSVLQAHGIETWRSSTEVMTAAQWERNIYEGLEACDWFLVVMSRHSAASHWVHAEVSWAVENRPGRIVPVLADDCDPLDLHLALRTIQYVDFRHNHEEARRRLLAVWDVAEAVNPYVVGKPVKGDLFVGRRDVLKMVEDNLGPAAGKNILVLRGQRRSGKTSVLLRLHETLAATSGGAYLPVLVDLQGMMSVKGEGAFLHFLAHHIWRDLGKSGIRVSKPVLADFASAPTNAFEFDFLGEVEAALGERRVLLMLDEFERLKELIERGDLSEDLLGYCRHLMQHSPLLFLIAGTHKLRELTGGYWSVFFNLALPIDIGALTEPEARWLITEPVRA